jgi:transposase-like protein
MKEQSESRLTLNGKPLSQPANPEVRPKQARRRRWSAAEKLRILEAADACHAPGEVGALLRREGVYSSQLSQWRRQRAEGGKEALAPKQRGRPVQVDPRDTELARLRRENERLQTRLAQAETIIEVQKKLSQLLGIPLTAPRDETS